MYQEQPGLDQNKQDFEDLVKIFNAKVHNMEKEQSDDREWDIIGENQVFLTNHACIWNKPRAVGYQVKIMQKDNKLALCQFIPRDKKEKKALESMKISLIHTIYRLEDLS